MDVLSRIDQRIFEYRNSAKERGEPVLRDKSFELLLETIDKHQPKSILEIGVNEGYSGISMLMISKDARLSGIEIDDDKILIAKNNYRTFKVEDRAKIFRGDAGEVIPIIDGEYDFIFLDGPKGHYFEYLPFLLNLLTKNGILFADNVLFRGYVDGRVEVPKKFRTTERSMKNFIQAITEDKNLNTKIYDIEDGVSITQKLV